jgi:hypothetical protein
MQRRGQFVTQVTTVAPTVGLRVLISSVGLCVQSFFARAARALRIIARRG